MTRGGKPLIANKAYAYEKEGDVPPDDILPPKEEKYTSN